jgi:hypothetical protein
LKTNTSFRQEKELCFVVLFTMYNIGSSTSLMFWGALCICRMHNYSYFRLGKMWRYYWQVHFVFVLWLSFHPQYSIFLYRRGIFIIDRYILYSSYDFRFTPKTQCFCTDVVYLLLTGTFCIRLMTFVSPPVFNVSVQTWYIYYWQVHFVFVLWLSFHP